MSSYGQSDSNQEYQYLVKFVIAGSSGAGKTSLLMRYVDDSFSTVFISTIGVDFKIKTIDVCGARTKLQMWDTAGQDRFRSVASSFYRNADAIIIVYDVSDSDSFTEVDSWVNDARRYGPSDCPMLLVGNKADLPEAVASETVKELAERQGMEYLQASAKTGSNVSEAFLTLAEKIVQKHREENGGFDPLPGERWRNGMQKSILLDGASTRPVPESSSWCFGGNSCSLV